MPLLMKWIEIDRQIYLKPEKMRISFKKKSDGIICCLLTEHIANQRHRANVSIFFWQCLCKIETYKVKKNMWF